MMDEWNSDFERRIDVLERCNDSTRAMIERIGAEARDLGPRVRALEAAHEQTMTKVAVVQNDYMHQAETLNEIRTQGRNNSEMLANMVHRFDEMNGSWNKQILTLATTGVLALLGAIWLYLKGGSNGG